MIGPFHRLRIACNDTTASQLAEFAIVLPLLMVLMIGIYDFSNALSVKQKVVNAAREGARFISNTPMTDYYPNPVSPPKEAAQVVGSVLLASNLSDCGLSTAAPTASGTLIWTYTANCPTGTLTLTVDRGSTYDTASAFISPYVIEATQVTISYPYSWTFNNVIGLVVPGANYPANTQITASAEMQNLN
jgi:hypothetical protein